MVSNNKEFFIALEKQIEKLDIAAHVEERGTVISVGDGVVRAYGLDNVKSGEVVEFSCGLKGVVFNLEFDTVGITVLGDDNVIKEGDSISRTGKLLQAPVGKELLGRVVDGFGSPIDGKGELNNTEYRFIESPAPGILDRKSVCQPLQTGIKAIDALIPIGLGQRELIIGDKKTGKTTIAIDTIINQVKSHANKKNPVYCVYVAIGQKCSTVAQIASKLEEVGALQYTIIVSARASDAAVAQYLSPYTGCAIGEYFRDNGMHALVIYDDLSKHAVAYREMSLLLRRPPGREAYPGDIFYLHSRLLERAAKLNDKLGGGSLTALPIVETQANDVSAYIPTNVISITDGQIFLESDLFYQGIRPAINVGVSVSRVGAAAQTKAIKKVSGKIKLELAQYKELARFTQFASDLNKDMQEILARGERLTEVMKQNLHSPLSVFEQSIILYAALNKYLKNVPLNKIAAIQEYLFTTIRAKNKNVIEDIESSLDISDENIALLQKILPMYIEEFLKS